MRYIKLTQGKRAIIDNEDFESVSKHKWFYGKVNGSEYAYSSTATKTMKQESLHRFILNVTKDKMVDYINGNGLDCRKSNMRICNRAENHRNLRKNKNNTSGFKGVCWDKSIKKYKSSIGHNGKKIHLGNYEDKIIAAQIYDKKAKELFGDFALPNLSMV